MGSTRGGTTGVTAAAAGTREETGVWCSVVRDLDGLFFGGDGRSSLLQTRFGGGVGFITERIDFSGFLETSGVNVGGNSSSLV